MVNLQLFEIDFMFIYASFAFILAFASPRSQIHFYLINLILFIVMQNNLLFVFVNGEMILGAGGRSHN